MWKAWNTKPIASRRSAVRPASSSRARSVPATMTSPESAVSSPAMMLSKVDLPAPDSPRIATCSPASSARASPSKSRRPPGTAFASEVRRRARSRMVIGIGLWFEPMKVAGRFIVTQPPLPGLKVWRATATAHPPGVSLLRELAWPHTITEKGAYAVKPSNRPERAEPYADRLARMDLGAGHIGHIPSHIYYRVGRYKDSLAVNKKAARQTRPISRSEAEVIAALSRDTDWSALVTGAASRTNAANSPEATRPAARHASPSARTRSQGRSLL